MPSSIHTRAPITLTVALGVALSGCSGPVQPRRLDLRNGHGVTVFFILGFLDEYLGRRVIEGDDLVEGLYCNEASKADVLMRQLDRLAREQDLPVAVRRDTAQGCLTLVRSSVVADALNAMYRDRDTPPIEQSWTTDSSGRRRRLTTLRVDERLFRDVDRELKLAYVAGAYARFGSGGTLRLANSQHKVAVLAALLKELGCSGVHTESTRGFVPQANTIFFEPSTELRHWLDRAW